MERKSVNSYNSKAQFMHSLEDIQSIIERDPTVINNPLDEYSNTILLIACKQGNIQVIDYLLTNCLGILNLNSQSSGGFSALHEACKSFQYEIVEKLLLAGIDPNLKDGHGRTALHWLSENQHEELGCLVLKHAKKLDANAIDYFGRTSLMWAAKKGQMKLLRMILDKKDVNINAKTNGGETALFWAALEGRREIVEILLKHGADITIKNSSEQTALEVSTDKQIIQLLQDELSKALKEKEAQNSQTQIIEDSPFVTKVTSKPTSQQNSKKLKITLKK